MEKRRITSKIRDRVEYGTLELPLDSVGEVNQSRTMKLKGKIGGASVVAMIDSGASHNFVSKKLIEELGLDVDESVRFGVYLGDGCRVPCQGVCRELRVDFGVCQLMGTYLS